MDTAILNRAEPSSWKAYHAGPYRAFPILMERHNNLPSKLRVLSEFAALATCKAFKGPDPKSPVARGEQAPDIAGREVLIWWRLPRDVPDTIETKQPEFGT